MSLELKILDGSSNGLKEWGLIRPMERKLPGRQIDHPILFSFKNNNDKAKGQTGNRHIQ